ncbi:AaceriAFR635Cp [[Ashbya] aceris (nom. inval.)]|nr:AaceriAFR635Cp [[Ashbya] aceris (nom. inval.)]
MSASAVKGVAAAMQPVSNTIKAGLLLSRIPIVTPEVSKLESQYYQYQSGLERRLMWTFPQFFYFKRGTLSERRFLNVQKGVVPKLPGVWFPKGIPLIKFGRDTRKKQEVNLPRETTEDMSSNDMSRPVVPNPRITPADGQNNTKSLERQLSRTLYLLVKSKEGWQLPSFSIPQAEGQKVPIHEAAESGIRELSNHEMKTWTVSNKPIGVLENDNNYTFLIKSHILAGDFRLADGTEYLEHAWLTKDEIKERVDAAYFSNIGFMLANV